VALRRRRAWTSVPRRAVPQAFTRCAQLDPDNGEAWNNLAAVHLRRGRPQEAFCALSEAVRLRRDSWQTWSNYAAAAAEAGHALQAVRGVVQVILRGDALPSHRFRQPGINARILVRCRG
jgi:Flp pilus assembly protein TadD